MACCYCNIIIIIIIMAVWLLLQGWKDLQSKHRVLTYHFLEQFANGMHWFCWSEYSSSKTPFGRNDV